MMVRTVGVADHRYRAGEGGQTGESPMDNAEAVISKLVTKSALVVSGRKTVTWPSRSTMMVHLPAG
jgi:hypothetical protein